MIMAGETIAGEVGKMPSDAADIAPDNFRGEI
jgi:hypothetical protein